MIVQTVKNDKNILEIMIDESPSSPREWDNFGTLIAWHNRYDLSDHHEKNHSDMREFLEYHTCEYYETIEGVENASDDRLMELFQRDHIMLPVYMYEHSGVVLNTYGFSCPWDSGQVGYIYISKDRVRKEYGVKRITKKLLEKVESILKSEIDIYSEYVNGNVYGYVLKDNEGNEVDSCWGFYGHDFSNNGMCDYIPSELHELV
jgi:hypothetical protein